MSQPLAPRYQLSRDDQIALTNRVRDWIDRLGLADWHYLSIEWLDDMDALAMCSHFVDSHSFRLQVRTHWDIPVCPQNIDYIVVHELLHVVLADLWQFAFDGCAPSQNNLLGRIEHQAIARLSRGLAHPTNVVRGLDGIEEIAPAGGIVPFPQTSTADELRACVRYHETAAEALTGVGGVVSGSRPMQAPLGQVAPQGSGSLAEDTARWFATAQDAMQHDREPIHGDQTGEAAKRWWQVSARDSNWLNGFTREGQMIEAFCAGAEWARRHMVDKEGM